MLSDTRRGQLSDAAAKDSWLKSDCAEDAFGAGTSAAYLAYVQSIPESHVAVVGMGRRDAAFDSGLPTPALHYRPGAKKPTAVPAGWEVTKLMDQHGYLKISSEDDVQVGDMLGFNISHPCLTFDKWRVLAMVDEKYDVVDVVKTYF